MKTKLVATLIAGFVSLSVSANNQERIASMKKDANVMQKIIETTSKTDIGQVKIEGTYIINQGFIFEVTGSNHSRFGFPIAPTPPAFNNHFDIEDWAEVYEDWGEAVADSAIASIDFSLAQQFGHDPDITDEVRAEIEREKEQLKNNIKVEQEKVRQLAREKRKLEQQLEEKLEVLVEEANKREYEKKRHEVEQLKKKQSELHAKIEQARKQKQIQAENYRKEMLKKQAEKQQKLEVTVLTNFCEYSSSLKGLGRDEQVSFLFPQRFNHQQSKKIYVFSPKQLKKCQNGGDKTKNILSNVEHYIF